MGKGFRPERAPAKQFPTCFIFATGSGISPIKALIESNELEVRLHAPAPAVHVAGDCAAGREMPVALSGTSLPQPCMSSGICRAGDVCGSLVHT